MFTTNMCTINKTMSTVTVTTNMCTINVTKESTVECVRKIMSIAFEENNS